MEEKVICFSCGLSPADIDKGRDSFARLHPEVPRPEVIALTGAMLELPVGEVLGEALFGGPPGAVQDTKETREELFPGIHTYRTVIVYAAEREQVSGAGQKLRREHAKARCKGAPDRGPSWHGRGQKFKPEAMSR